MIRKSPHSTHRDERYFEIRCAALESQVRELKAALRKAYETMGGATVFVTSRERIRDPEGVQWWNDAMKEIGSVLGKDCEGA